MAGTPMTMVQALRSAMDVMLARDEKVVIYGQDVGYFGGVFRCTDGLQARHGRTRVFDAPIFEGGIVGSATGIAPRGPRPAAASTAARPTARARRCSTRTSAGCAP